MTSKVNGRSAGATVPRSVAPCHSSTVSTSSLRSSDILTGPGSTILGGSIEKLKISGAAFSGAPDDEPASELASLPVPLAPVALVVAVSLAASVVVSSGADVSGKLATAVVSVAGASSVML